jgi:hypothetical protein
MCRSQELYPFGTAYQMMDQIKMLGIAFNYYKEVDLEEARELLIYAGTTFLDIINSNEEIRKYLDVYPFKPENVDIRIFLQNLDGTEFSPEKLCVITMIDGMLEYDAKNPETLRLLRVHKETYDKAVKKIYSSNKSIAM